jgi:hypothetical protein
MATRTRIGAISLLGAACLVGLSWTAWRAVQHWVLPELIDLAAQSRRSQQLDGALQGMLRRVAEQRQVARQVLGGRLTLLEAAACLRVIWADEPPPFRAAVRRHFPGVTEEEWLCRRVIAFVAGELEDGPPEQARDWEQRLRAELSQHLQRGPLRLPG